MRAFYTVYLIFATFLTLVAMEYAAMLHNRSKGVSLPFLLADRSELEPRNRGRFTLLDPHLGYAHAENEPENREINSPHHFLPGFIVYSDQRLGDRSGVRIVTLGGSTTDPLMYRHSWPEELAKFLAARGIEATVINGGVGGYSSSQELLKLVRDVLELEPDIVIGYHGLNDLNNWGPLPTPMVHTYQRQLFEHLIKGSVQKPIFPNAAHLFEELMNRRPAGEELVGVTYGVATGRSAGEFLVRNIDLMHHISKGMGFHYLSFLQPAVGVGDYDMNETDAARLEARGEEYLRSLQEAYDFAGKAATERPYMVSLIDVFSQHQDIFKKDGRHLRRRGNQIIARTILDVLLDRGWLEVR